MPPETPDTGALSPRWKDSPSLLKIQRVCQTIPWLNSVQSQTGCCQQIHCEYQYSSGQPPAVPVAPLPLTSENDQEPEGPGAGESQAGGRAGGAMGGGGGTTSVARRLRRRGLGIGTMVSRSSSDGVSKGGGAGACSGGTSVATAGCTQPHHSQNTESKTLGSLEPLLGW